MLKHRERKRERRGREIREKLILFGRFSPSVLHSRAAVPWSRWSDSSTRNDPTPTGNRGDKSHD